MRRDSEFMFGLWAIGSWPNRKTKRDGAEHRLYQKCLADYVLPGFDDAVCDLLCEADHVERLILEQSAQDYKLRAQHVAFGDCGQNFSGCGFNLVQRICEADLHHGYRVLRFGLTLTVNQLLRPQDH